MTHNVPVAAWATRHLPTPAQAADFAAYHVVPVRDRFRSVRGLWLDVLLACQGRPDVLVLVWKHDEVPYAVKFIQRQSPHTQIVRPLTNGGSDVPTGVYAQLFYEAGKGVNAKDWQPVGAEVAR